MFKSPKISRDNFDLLKNFKGRIFRVEQHDLSLGPVLQMLGSTTLKKNSTKKIKKSSIQKRVEDALKLIHPEIFITQEKPYENANDSLGGKKDMVTDKVRGVTSPTQSSKTSWTIAQALLALNEGRSAIIVPRNFEGDQIQLRKRVKHVEKRMQQELQNHNYTIKFLTCLNGSESSAKKREEAFREGGYIFIALANSVQLQHLVNESKGYPGSYDLFIDEADATDYGKELRKIEEEETEEFFVQRALAFDNLKKNAYRTFCISATLMGVIMNEPTMLSTDLIRLTPPCDYRGFDDIAGNIKLLKHRVDGYNKFRTWEEWIENDKNLLPFLTTFSTREPHLIGVGTQKGPRLHPQICLLNVTTCIGSQKSIVDGIAAHERLGEKLVVIGVNGDGISMYLPTDDDEYHFRLKNDKQVPLKITPGKFTKNPRLTISSVLQYIYEENSRMNRNHEEIKTQLLYSSIVIVSGRCVGRGISVVSNNFEYHLPTLYLTPSPTMSIPNLIQSMGRLCGRNKGKAILELHATAEVVDCLHRGLLCERELLERAVATPVFQDGEEQPLASSIKAIPINISKVPYNKRSLTKGRENTKSLLNLIKGEDGGFALEDYLLKQEGRDISIGYCTKIEKMFSKWSDPRSKSHIAEAIRSIKDPVATYSRTEWSDKVRFSDVVVSEKTLRAHKYNPFVQKLPGSMWRVHPELVDLFRKYFE